MSKASLESMGITNPNAKLALMQLHFNQIKDQEHFDNIVKYIKRKQVLMENDNILWRQDNRTSILAKIRELKHKPKHTPEEMAEFRQDYPNYNSWKGDAIRLRLSKNFTNHLQSLEDQRLIEDQNYPLTKQELKKLVPFKSFIEFIRNIRIKVNAHPSNSGYACILGGKANTYKSTICDILAMSFGSYHTWPGTQFIKEDVLKYDSAARAAISTIVIEECKWINLLKKVTLNDTFCMLKEQLSGSGLNVRLAKNKNCVDDLILKIERFFISFNPDEFVDCEDMESLINRKPEFKRRFYLFNMDTLELANLFGKPKQAWNDDYKLLIAKLLRNPINWEKFCDILEQNNEIAQIMENIEEYETDEEEQFDMKTQLTDLFPDGIPDNQQELDEIKNSILFD